MKLYCYPRCTTCKKAVKWLEDNGKTFDYIDIKNDNPDEDIIRDAYIRSSKSLKKFFNTSGKLYREMELSKKLKDMSEEEQIKLLADNGMLVKRPLLISEDIVLIGFKEEEWKEML